MPAIASTVQVDFIQENLSHVSRKVRPIENWNYWLERYAAAQTLEEMEGLLYVGFDVACGSRKYGEPEYTKLDRFELYFREADGWLDRSDPRWRETQHWNETKFRVGFNSEGYPILLTESELHRRIASKAAKMLCVHYFKQELKELESGSGQHYWVFTEKWAVGSGGERLLEMLISFFKPTLDLHHRVVRNLYTGGYETPPEVKVMIEFLIKLIDSIWTWEEEWPKGWWKDEERAQHEANMQAIRTQVAHAKLWSIEVLSCLKKLELLRKYWADFDEQVIAKLTEVAMMAELSEHLEGKSVVKKSRKVESVAEACRAGSAAGWILNYYELMSREQSRLVAIRDAERAQEEATAQLERARTAK